LCYDGAKLNLEGSIVVLQACGLNHKTAPVALRECFAFDESRSQKLLKALTQRSGVNGAVLLSTCNRTEVYVDASELIDLPVWLADQGEQSYASVSEHFYTYIDDALVRHLMRVASGLDSMVLGESQILGQMKAAYASAECVGSVSYALKQLFPAVFSGCKEIRSNTNLGKCPVSVAYMAVKLIKEQFNDLSQCRVLLLGNGDMMELVATHLQSHAVKAMTVIGRRLNAAETLAKTFNAQAMPFSALREALLVSDIVICATSSRYPIITRSMVESVMSTRGDLPIFIADLAVPRDVSPEVSQFTNVHLYNIDDLQSIVQNNLSSREAAIDQVEAMIALHADNFQRRQRVADCADLITQFRDGVDTIRDIELSKAIALLEKGHPPETVLKQFSHAFVNKLLHQPTSKLREFASQNRAGALSVMKEFLKL
tara:strand:- start:946 stop:2229 length:1284 start_codon:yes stop_codon:yes gene_type:complete